MAVEMAAALREASQPCQEMDHPAAPALGEYFDVDARRRSTGDSGRFSWRGSFYLSSPTFIEDTASLAESMIASRETTELCAAGRAGNEYIAVEASIRDAGIELDGEDEGAINASGRAAQTRRRSDGLPRKRLSASDLGVIDQDATEVEPLYDALSFPTPPVSPDTHRADTSDLGVREPFYLAPRTIRRQLDSNTSGDNGADRQVLGHAYDNRLSLSMPPTKHPKHRYSRITDLEAGDNGADRQVLGHAYDNRLSLSMPPTKHPKHRYSLITDLEASGDNGADRQVLGHAYDDLGLAPPDEQHATSCCASEQAYEYDSRLSLSMPPTKPPKHRYSLITDLEASGDNGADRQILGHAYDDLGLAPPDEQHATSCCASEQAYEYDSRLSLSMPPTKPPKHRYSLITDLEAAGDNGADRQILGHAYDDLGLAPPDEQHATSCCASEQAYEYDSRLSLSMPPTKPPKHRYSLIADSGIYEHICTVTHH